MHLSAMRMREQPGPWIHSLLLHAVPSRCTRRRFNGTVAGDEL